MRLLPTLNPWVKRYGIAQPVSIGQHRQSPEPLGGELDKGIDLGGAMGTALGDEVHRQRRRLPGLQQTNQLARPKLVSDLIREQLRDAASVARRTQARLDVVDPEPPHQSR